MKTWEDWRRWVEKTRSTVGEFKGIQSVRILVILKWKRKILVHYRKGKKKWYNHANKFYYPETKHGHNVYEHLSTLSVLSSFKDRSPPSHIVLSILKSGQILIHIVLRNVSYQFWIKQELQISYSSNFPLSHPKSECFHSTMWVCMEICIKANFSFMHGSICLF